MKWENLKEDKCPHCGAPLMTEHNDVPRKQCTKCTFHLALHKFESILKYGAGKQGATTHVRMIWARLKKGNCPACNSMLHEKLVSQGSPCSLVCIKESCNFRIWESKLQQYLQDDNHPIHREEENEREQSALGYSPFAKNITEKQELDSVLDRII